MLNAVGRAAPSTTVHLLRLDGAFVPARVLVQYGHVPSLHPALHLRLRDVVGVTVEAVVLVDVPDFRPGVVALRAADHEDERAHVVLRALQVLRGAGLVDPLRVAHVPGGVVHAVLAGVAIEALVADRRDRGRPLLRRSVDLLTGVGGAEELALVRLGCQLPLPAAAG